MMHCVKILNHLAFVSLLSVIRLYRVLISPMLQLFTTCIGLPFSCKYPLTCSDFAEAEIRSSSNLFKTVYRVTKRVLSCSPFYFHKLKAH